MNKKIKNQLKRINSGIISMKGMSPLENIPAIFLDRYTLGGKIKVGKKFFTKLAYRIFQESILKKEFNHSSAKSKRKKKITYKGTNRWLY